MKYLVVRPHSHGLSAISIVEGDDTMLDPPFESWALLSGRAILFANSRLPQMMKQFYVSGTFQGKALYTYSWDEVCAIVASQIGPSDRERYEQVQRSSKRISITHGLLVPHPPIGLTVLMESAWLVLFTIGKVLGLIVFVLILPFVIMMVNKRR